MKVAQAFYNLFKTLPEEIQKQVLYLIKEDENKNLASTIEQKTYNVNQVRKVHPDAYKPWTIEADDELKSAFKRGCSIDYMAEYLGRNEGAIRSRLRKLGLVE